MVVAVVRFLQNGSYTGSGVADGGVCGGDGTVVMVAGGDCGGGSFGLDGSDGMI